jgi:hypothetical protein
VIQKNNIDYGCWRYTEAATILNQALKGREWEDKYNNLELLVDSMKSDLIFSELQFDLMNTNYGLCMEKSGNKDQIILLKDQEITLLDEELSRQKLHKWGAVGIAGLLFLLLISN